jgi:hypothetical protein
MPNSKKEWDCKVHNPACILTQEGGMACQNSIRAGNCSRPIPRDGISSLYRVYVFRQKVSANVEPTLANGTNI